MRSGFVPTCFVAVVIASLRIPSRASAAAPASTCPQIWSFVRVANTDRYALILRASAPIEVDATLKLRSSDEATTEIFQSSGKALLDAAGCSAAIASQFEVAGIACTTTASTSIFHADFAQ